jgi:hypothetical protein
MRNDFVAFVLTHGRPNTVYTLNSLRTHGYTGKVIFIVDNEDKTVSEYRKNFGSENVYVFDKLAVSKTFDEADNFKDRRAIVYARNVCFDVAKELGYKYFIELDDDYTEFRNTFDNDRNYITKNIHIKKLDLYLTNLIAFLESVPNLLSVCMSQGGDFIGGEGSQVAKNHQTGKFTRKVMNSFICSTDKPFKFNGRLNEDVNTYTRLANTGALFLTIPRVRLEQKQTQSNAGGMTDIYLDGGTYIKSFYTVMFQPSSVKIKMMGVSNRRLHHSVAWDKTLPQIVSEDYKK